MDMLCDYRNEWCNRNRNYTNLIHIWIGISKFLIWKQSHIKYTSFNIIKYIQKRWAQALNTAPDSLYIVEWKKVYKKIKKVVDFHSVGWYYTKADSWDALIWRASSGTDLFSEIYWRFWKIKNLKKLLTNRWQFDIINELSLITKTATS